jgi:glucosamine--fructose-6-phosphate aminotransferase (isomerizing)
MESSKIPGMRPDSPYALVHEMLEAPGLLRRFDPAAAAGWAEEIARKGKLFLTGEGASRIFPAKNMIDLALRRKMPWHIHTEGARQAAEYDLKDFFVIGASNSGQTRELAALFEKLSSQGLATYGITATPGSRLTEISGDCRILSCGAEKAVAATKSVVEQALVLQSLLRGEEWKRQNEAADLCAQVLAEDIPADISAAIANAPVTYFSGRNDGVAEELALKANEIVRQKSAYLEGTYALHGIEEVMSKGEAVVLVDPFRDEIEKYRSILQQGAGLSVIAIASFDTPFPTIKIPALEGFNGYIQLLAGWNLLVAAGRARGIDLDKTARARKVGNAL